MFNIDGVKIDDIIGKKEFIALKIQPKLILLVGVPCSGKSTYTEGIFGENCFILNADAIQMEVLNTCGWEYHERFEKPSEHELEHPRYGRSVDGNWSEVESVNAAIDDLFSIRVANAVEWLDKGGDVVIDLTCHTKPYRSSVLQWFFPYLQRNKFCVSAVVFEFQSIRNRIFELNEKRGSSGKHIPQKRIEEMMDEFEAPSLKEGFDEIIFFQGIENT